MSVCVLSDRRTPADYSLAGRTRAVPGVPEAAPMRSIKAADLVAYKRDLARVLGLVDLPAHYPETLIEQVRVHDVAFAVIAHVLEATGRDGGRDRRAAHAELAGEAGEPRHRVESCVGARLIHGEHVHQIEMARVKAGQVIVEPEVAVIVAPIPITRRRDTVHERAILEDRQIERSTVPRHELRRIALDAVEEPPHQLRLRVAQLAERPHAKRRAFPQHAADRNDALKMKRRKIAAAARAPVVA